jgi:predicted membrane protein
MQTTSPVMAFVRLCVLGIVGAIPLAILASAIYGGQIGLHMWVLGGVLVGTWFPTRQLIYQRIHGQSAPMLSSLIPDQIFLLAMVFLILLLWWMTFTALLVGILVYAFIGQNLLLALIAGLSYQSLMLYREAQRVQEASLSSPFFGNFQDFAERFGMETIVISSDDVVTVNDDKPDVVYHLPESSTSRIAQDDDEEVIIIESDTSEQRGEQD